MNVCDRGVRFRWLAVAICAFLLLLPLVLASCGNSAQPTTTASTSQGAASTTDGSQSTTSASSAVTAASTSDSLLMYAGSASKPPTEEAIKTFEQKTFIKIEVVYGGSGKVLSQMKLAKEGDLYFPGSSDYMEKAKKEGDVVASTEARIAYLVPSINVQKGNPKNIETLSDLIKPGIKVAIANPETVCVGLYAVEIVEKDMSAAEKSAFKANLLNYTDSCEKTATAVSLKQVDAVIGWSVFQDWSPDTIQTVPLSASQTPRVGYIPIAVATYTKKQAEAQQFIDFLASQEGQAIFAKYGYFTTSEQAFAYVGAEKPVGGEYTLPADWVTE